MENVELTLENANVITDMSKTIVASVPCQLTINAPRIHHAKTENVKLLMENLAATVTMDMPKITVDSV
jgi:hypothetical protein